jgi:hypothetical protein
MFLVNQVSEMVRTSKGLFSKRRSESILLVMLLTFRCAILSPRLLGKPMSLKLCES